MSRLKPLLIVVAVTAAISTLVKTRLSDQPQVDPGGWKPVDPT